MSVKIGGHKHDFVSQQKHRDRSMRQWRKGTGMVITTSAVQFTVNTIQQYNTI